MASSILLHPFTTSNVFKAKAKKKKEVAGVRKKRKKEAFALWAPFAGGAACKAGAGPPKTQDTVSRGFVIADVSLCQL